jgi:hypothetical protein
MARPGLEDFALAAGVARIDGDPRPISDIPEDELLLGGQVVSWPTDCVEHCAQVVSVLWIDRKQVNAVEDRTDPESREH